MKQPDQLTDGASDSIFVIVWVDYDYYRFQDNLAATTDLEEARAIAAEKAESLRFVDVLPVIESAAESSSMDARETSHIWIESFPQDTKGTAILADHA